ncbi:UPF0134 protein [Frankliniella fusca]|uniref:UPF0134 protein n=1 Tax=Frankliniella fusca TaxID=407009 RepID=A0AAE1HR65_9NEOP|nr:UPF0134 protein [Frankliniella fusca]
MSGDREDANAELDKLGKDAKRTTKDPEECPASTSGQQVQVTRRSSRTTRNQTQDMITGTSTVSSTQRKRKSPVEFKSDVLLAKNRKVAETYSNRKVMNWLQSKGEGGKDKNDNDDDNDYEPEADRDDISSQSSGCSDILQNFNANNVRRKKARENLVKGIRSLSPSSSSSKEALKVQLREAQWKFKILYENSSEKQEIGADKQEKSADEQEKSAKKQEETADKQEERADKQEERADKQEERADKQEDNAENQEDNAKQNTDKHKELIKKQVAKKAEKTDDDDVSALSNSESLIGMNLR